MTTIVQPSDAATHAPGLPGAGLNPLPDPNTLAFVVPSIAAGTSLAAGTPVTFQLFSPKVLSLGAVPVDVPVGTIVSWAFQDHDSKNTLIEGIDYQVLDGSLDEPVLQVVFKPVASRTVDITPTVTLLTAALQYAPSTNSLPPLSYGLQTLSSAEGLVDDLINKVLCLTTPNTIINPGETAVLNVLPRQAAHVPQLATSVVHDVPSVTIRGAIPLDSLVEALLGPAAGFSKFATGGKVNLEGALTEVRQLLQEPLAIPIALDIQGQRLATTLTAIGVPELPTLTSTPGESGHYEGFLPVGSWQSQFSIASVTWTLTDSSGNKVSAADLSQGVDFLKTYVLMPDVVDMTNWGAISTPHPVTVTAALAVSVDTSVFGTDTITVTLGPLTLQRVPLPVPPIAALFTNVIDELPDAGDEPQYCCVAVPNELNDLVSCYDDFIKVTTRVSSVLNNLVAVMRPAGLAQADITDAATALSTLLDEVGRLDPANVLFVPMMVPGGGPTTLTNQFNDSISAVIAIAPGTKVFRLSDKEHPESYINFAWKKSPGYYISSIVKTLNGASGSLPMSPVGSAASSQGSVNMNDGLEVIQFIS